MPPTGIRTGVLIGEVSAARLSPFVGNIRDLGSALHGTFASSVALPTDPLTPRRKYELLRALVKRDKLGPLPSLNSSFSARRGAGAAQARPRGSQGRLSTGRRGRDRSGRFYTAALVQFLTVPTSRAQKFPRDMSLRISICSSRSATIRFSRWFSSRRWRSSLGYLTLDEFGGLPSTDNPARTLIGVGQ